MMEQLPEILKTDSEEEMAALKAANGVLTQLHDKQSALLKDALQTNLDLREKLDAAIESGAETDKKFRELRKAFDELIATTASEDAKVEEVAVAPTLEVEVKTLVQDLTTPEMLTAADRELSDYRNRGYTIGDTTYEFNETWKVRYVMVEGMIEQTIPAPEDKLAIRLPLIFEKPEKYAFKLMMPDAEPTVAPPQRIEEGSREVADESDVEATDYGFAEQQAFTDMEASGFIKSALIDDSDKLDSHKLGGE